MSSLVTEIRRNAGASLALALLTVLVGSTAAADAADRSSRGIPATERAHKKLTVGESHARSTSSSPRARTSDCATTASCRTRRPNRRARRRARPLPRPLRSSRSSSPPARPSSPSRAASPVPLRASTGRPEPVLPASPCRARTPSRCLTRSTRSTSSTSRRPRPSPRRSRSPRASSPARATAPRRRAAASTPTTRTPSPAARARTSAIVDIEYSWNRSHEDLSKAEHRRGDRRTAPPCDPSPRLRGATDHGTAVLGRARRRSERLRRDRPRSRRPDPHRQRRESERAPAQCDVNLANAINVAAANSSPGDVILIEQQTSGPNRKDRPKSDVGYVPVEWDQTGAVTTAIRNATARGRIVVEAAGNGYQNLDDADLQRRDGRNWFSYDSGAIMVGAGNAPGCTWGSDPRSRGAGSRSRTTAPASTSRAGAAASRPPATAALRAPPSATPRTPRVQRDLERVADRRGGAALALERRRGTRHDADAGDGAVDAQVDGSGGSRRKQRPHRPAARTCGRDRRARAEARRIRARRQRHEPRDDDRARPPELDRLGQRRGQYDVRLSTGRRRLRQADPRLAEVAAAIFALAREHNYQFAARAVRRHRQLGGRRRTVRSSRLGSTRRTSRPTNPAYAGTWTRLGLAACLGRLPDRGRHRR